ncbi:hypothetical protein JG687_00006736, partial [Phytophthora cactorum]
GWFEARKWLEQDWSKIDSDVDILLRRKEPLPFPSMAFVFVTNLWQTCYVLSALLWVSGWLRTPKKSLLDIKFIAHPVNLNGNLWGIIIVRLSYIESAEMMKVHVYMYEPLIDDEYHGEMETVWEGMQQKDDDAERQGKEGLRGFVERWHQASIPKSKLVINSIEWVEAPEQPDSASCCVLVVAQAHHYLTGNTERHSYSVSKNDLNVMCLRMFWRILHHSKERALTSRTPSNIDQKLKDELE